MERTRVVVIGAGPVGVIAAYRLVRAGIDVVVLESEPRCPEDMRASTLHPPTLEMLSDLGVLETLEAEGLRAPVYHYRNRRTQEVLAFDLNELADLTPFPYRLQCEQFKITRLLTRLIAADPHGEVRFSRRLLGFDQDANGVTLSVEAPFAIEALKCDYVIAADGANSLARKLLGITFEGFTYPEKFLTLSTKMAIEEAIPGLAFVNYVADPEEWCVLLRVPEFWRVLVPAAEADRDEDLLSDAKKTDVFRGLLGAEAAGAVRTHHRTIYRVHQRVAQTYRGGRVLLAGDAAHLNNPLGGFGMNSGVHDAWNLTDKLICLLGGGGGDADALLDRYDRQRRTVMNEFVQAQTIRNKKLLESSSAEAQVTNQREMEAIIRDDERRRDYLMTQAMLKSRAREAAIA
jgi:3-(3-hydroxy-phenyl)propionate hydroxylase